MIRTSLLLALIATAVPAQTAPAPQATATAPPSGFARAIPLWPARAPLQKGDSPADIPTLYAYPAAGAGVHPAVIVLPGGGYTHLAIEKEGAAEARWLNARGVTAFVLAYRLSPAYRFPAPMLDGARAVRYVRAEAEQLAVDPVRIGVWGFSAGGHLAGYLATIHDAGKPASDDPIERVSDRPDFAILSYARLSLAPEIPRTGNMEALVGDAPTQAALDAVKHVDQDTSPSFLYGTGGDKSVDPLNASAYYTALRHAGVPAELHLFELGPHGTGLAQNLPDLHELSLWPQLLASWMRQNKWMRPAPGPVDFP